MKTIRLAGAWIAQPSFNAGVAEVTEGHREQDGQILTSRVYVEGIDPLARHGRRRVA
jgi:hypothetical protein